MGEAEEGLGEREGARGSHMLRSLQVLKDPTLVPVTSLPLRPCPPRCFTPIQSHSRDRASFPPQPVHTPPLLPPEQPGQEGGDCGARKLRCGPGVRPALDL